LAGVVGGRRGGQSGVPLWRDPGAPLSDSRCCAILWLATGPFRASVCGHWGGGTTRQPKAITGASASPRWRQRHSPSNLRSWCSAQSLFGNCPVYDVWSKPWDRVKPQWIQSRSCWTVR